ncbi:hypothetical protein OEA41_010338 [Lepraria neglecta]|uniref:Uncharacterized protein n=1 Tax=Lepraria neglecta TaxID=209136 RepID=A0AAD9YZM2_9LECA|nr:hypothetical protein OEA41_010338 [Lepraria neglecta]
MNVSLETRLSVEQHSADPADASDTEKVSPLQSESLAKLPPEIRNMIYRKMLAAKKPLLGVHQLVGPKKSILVRKIPKVQDGVDSTILRHGFVKQGGVFVAKDEHEDAIVMDNGPRKESRGVREILEMLDEKL